ncbi:hypothetical protein MNBD_GAMMA21-2790 [hydrothermal vent metagenome]|uniref:Uncharacterized protein n=1 Tax=hydrothermal vent metagenome TaxID=652676 RepID=A0A3B1AD79_9ZZZZ
MDTKKKPGWVTAVAIIAIVLSGFGVMGGIQEALTPFMLDAQRADYELMIEELNNIAVEVEQSNNVEQNTDIKQIPGPEQQQVVDMFKSFAGLLEKILNMPEWYLNWLVLSGIISILIHGFYLFASIWLMQLKPYAPRYLAIALPLSIAFALVRTTIAVQALDSMALLLMGGTLIAMSVEVVLLLVLITKDKSAFKQFEA